MMSKHTPGPWRLILDTWRYPVVQRQSAGGFQVMALDDDVAVADARLIATAPELLDEHERWARQFGAALMAVMQEDYGPIRELAISMPFDFHGDGSPTLRSDAIAKATGGQ